MLGSTRRAVAAGLLALALAAPGLGQAQSSFSRIVVFGTSLSDPGNAFALFGGTNTPPNYLLDQNLVPYQPYARGGHHFSNGATWVEQLAQSLGLAQSARAAFRSASGASNYAIGGTRARATTDAVPTLAMQKAAFQRQFPGQTAPADALYVIELGANDLFDALVAQDPAPVGAALEAIGGLISYLHWAGARSFLVVSVPNIGRTPAVLAMPGAAAGATYLTMEFNKHLKQLLDRSTDPSHGLPGIQITWLDAFGEVEKIVSNKESYGLTTVDRACITPESAPYHCQDFDEYLFWDGIHPTKAAHGIVANKAAAAVLSPSSTTP